MEGGGEKLTVAAGRVPDVLDSCQISAADILPNSACVRARARARSVLRLRRSRESGYHLSSMCATGVAHFHEAALEKCFFERIAPAATRSKIARFAGTRVCPLSLVARARGESRLSAERRGNSPR